METPLEKLNAKVFAEHRRSKFHTQLGDRKVELELLSVEEPESSPKVEVFFLTFHGPLTPRLPQRIYLLEHEKMGTFSIFLTAIAGDAEGISYEAVFNRYKKK
ncbi:MAG TPA: hypothetical protein VI685_10210 [Candidatus Angelobacter sp.]